MERFDHGREDYEGGYRLFTGPDGWDGSEESARSNGARFEETRFCWPKRGAEATEWISEYRVRIG